MTKPVVWSPHY